MTLKSAVVGDPGSSPRGRGKLHRRRDLIPNRRLIPVWAGKTMADRSATSSHPGSSPRGRGKRQAHGLRDADEGLIPAWAGKTLRTGGGRRGRGAHPRVGGENLSAKDTAGRPLGSSPRGRGKRPKAVEANQYRRLIPAWAGKTRTRRRIRRRKTAHPRVGGENRPGAGRRASRSGSSPRGRGKPERRGDDRAQEGLIPAWAGKTMPPRSLRPPARAHPRVGGENQTRWFVSPSPLGSSPRGRGKRGETLAGAGLIGLIPAWAGKTRPRREGSSGPRAHPRVGGENAARVEARSGSAGSSPRGRGKRSMHALGAGRPRLIPAWAGKTNLAVHAFLAHGAHPRVGGENVPSRCPALMPRGSSPRGRGKPGHQRLRRAGPGLIPAWAGKTHS